MNDSTTATRLRRRIAGFSGEVSVGLGVVASRFVNEMVYGIEASQSVVLTEVARALEEEVALRKTQWRLSRNLQREQLGDVVGDNVARLGGRRINEESVLVIDSSDISKKYARKMEHLAWVWDGSEGKLTRGYSTLHVIGAKVDSKEIVPLYQRLYSTVAPEFVSENEEILRAIDAVRAHMARKGLWVMDRAGDRIKLFVPMLEREERFLFRMVGKRSLVVRGESHVARNLAYRCRCPHAATIVRVKDGKETVYTLTFGYCKVRLPGRPEPLCMIVVRGLGEGPLMLLTNEPLRRSFKVLWRMVRAYLTRWAIEETIRYLKTCYEVENVRVLNYTGLQNLMPLVLAATFFTAVVLETEAKLRIMAAYVKKAAKRLFGIPDFKYYALSDGLRSLFTRHPGRPARIERRPQAAQLDLFALDGI
jgi:hypothetical protein